MTEKCLIIKKDCTNNNLCGSCSHANDALTDHARSLGLNDIAVRDSSKNKRATSYCVYSDPRDARGVIPVAFVIDGNLNSHTNASTLKLLKE